MTPLAEHWNYIIYMKGTTGLKRIAALLLGLTLTFGAASVASAQKWSLDEMNKTINQTNFIVNRGCSGTLIDLEKRLVLTNYHCIDGNVESVEREVVSDEGWVKKIKVRRYTDIALEQNAYDGFVKTGSQTYVGEIVAEQQTVDLALVKIKGVIPQTVASKIIASDTLVRGEAVYIVGNPGGNDNTVVEGIISNLNRSFDFPWTNGGRLPMIQFSGGIFGGNSGGSLYNANGEFIGVPAAGYNGATFIGLAIPAHVVKVFLKSNCFESAFTKSADDAACVAAKEAKRKKDKE